MTRRKPAGEVIDLMAALKESLLKDKVARLEAENAALRDAMKRLVNGYTDHGFGCPAYGDFTKECQCGLDAAVRAARSLLGVEGKPT